MHAAGTHMAPDPPGVLMALRSPRLPLPAMLMAACLAAVSQAHCCALECVSGASTAPTLLMW